LYGRVRLLFPPARALNCVAHRAKEFVQRLAACRIRPNESCIRANARRKRAIHARNRQVENPPREVDKKWIQIGHKLPTAFGCGKTIVRVPSVRFPAVCAVLQLPLVKSEYNHGSAKSPRKRQKAPFCDQVTQLPAPIRRLVSEAKPGETPLEALFSDLPSLPEE
jgi:hypothetical protein